MLSFLMLSLPVIASDKDSVVNIPEGQKSQPQYPLKNGYPIWFSNPNHDGYMGAIGIAKKQRTGGYNKQKRLAHRIALAEIAKQIKVRVDSELTIEKTLIDTKGKQEYREKVQSLSKHETQQLIRNAIIKDEWIDPKTEELYLWVVIGKANN